MGAREGAAGIDALNPRPRPRPRAPPVGPESNPFILTPFGQRYHHHLQHIPEEERVRQLNAAFPDTRTKRMLRLEHDKFPVPTSLTECLPYSIPGCVKVINSRKSPSNEKRHHQEMMQIIQKEFAPGAHPPTWVVLEHVDGTMSNLHGWSFW